MHLLIPAVVKIPSRTVNFSAYDASTANYERDFEIKSRKMTVFCFFVLFCFVLFCFFFFSLTVAIHSKLFNKPEITWRSHPMKQLFHFLLVLKYHPANTLVKSILTSTSTYYEITRTPQRFSNHCGFYLPIIMIEIWVTTW